MFRMLGLEHQLVPPASRLKQLGPRPLIHDAGERPAADRIGLDQEDLIFKPERTARTLRLPAGLGGSRIRRPDYEAAEPDPRHSRTEGDPDRLQRAVRSPGDAL